MGLTGIRLHDLRRTFIAVHVEAGTHPKLVQDRMGHSDIKLTMDVYGKLAGKKRRLPAQGKSSARLSTRTRRSPVMWAS